MTNSTPLSSAAQAVMTAIIEISPAPADEIAAAALRTVTKELKYFGITEKNILAIAAELEVEPTLREEFTTILNEARCNSPGRVIGNIELGCRLVAAVERFTRTQPEPERPDAGEVMQLADNYFSFRGNSHRDQFFATSMEARKDPTQSLQDFARAVLARWGCPALQPVPVSECLPGPEDCDAEGECYWFDPEGSGAWYQDTYQGNYTHWLPVHALPQPS